MGNQVSKVSPSMLGLRSRAVREDVAMRRNVPFTPTPAMISLPTKSIGHVEVPENGFTTPRSRGRSAIYNMARTPYSRVHPTALDKVLLLKMTFYQKLLNVLPHIYIGFIGYCTGKWIQELCLWRTFVANIIPKGA